MTTAPIPLLRAELDRFAAHYRLTTREHDVLFLLISGHGTVPLIAERLGLSQNTVHNHFKNVFRRTRTNSKAGLLSLFIRDSIGRTAGMRPFVKRPRVLLVGEQAAGPLVDALSGRGLHVFAERRSSEAQRRVRELRIDIVVTGAGASRGAPADALDVLGSVIETDGRQPLVFVIADAPGAERAGWLERGASGVFQAPVSADGLTFAILEGFVDSPYERNRLLRVDTTLPVRIDRRTDASIDNLGFGGAFVAVPAEQLEDPRAYAVGSKISLDFPLDEEASMEVEGEIVWRRDESRPSMASGVGVRFVDLSDEQRARVEDYVRRRKLLGFKPWLAEDEPPRGARTG